MLSKEEILNKHLNWMLTEPSPARTGILTAMDEYAKQEAIAFAKFATDVVMNKVSVVPFETDSELYQQYLEPGTTLVLKKQN